MKIKYLSAEDRKNLRLLRHSSDINEKIVILESLFRRPFYTLQALWEYRKYYMELSEEQLREHPALVCGLAHIYSLYGDIDKANETLSLFPTGSRYYLMTKMTMSHTKQQEVLQISKRLQENGWKFRNITLTAGRPSVINGLWDMTPYIDDLLRGQEETFASIEYLFEEQVKHIRELMMAEAMYWRDDCYAALVKAVSVIPFFRERQDMRLLFAAMTLEIYILVLNGQAITTAPLIENLRHQIRYAEVEEYLPNIDALEARMAMYDGDYAKITRWMREDAPDEYSRFCLLDLFRYMVKLRGYIIQGRYLAVTSLASRLLPSLEAGNRIMDTCELHIIWAMSDFADGRKEEALDHIEKALVLAERYHYDRLIANEGYRILEILRYYCKTRCQGKMNKYLERVISLSDKTSAMHPGYLKGQLPNNPALTDTEMRVLRLLAELKTNAEISEITGMAEETAKKHCKHIFAKLEVKNRHQAVDKAMEFGLIEPKKYG